MKILMIAPQPFFTPRGTPFSVLYRLHALSKLGHTIDLVTYHLGENISIENVTIHRIPNIPFVRNIEVGPSKKKIVLDVFIILKALRLLIQHHYDVIHSHEEAGFFSTYLSKMFGLKHLYDMHSSLPQQLDNFQFTKSKIIVNLFKILEKKTIRDADAVITICPELFHYVKGMFPEKNHELIENVVENELVLGDSSETSLDIFGLYHSNKHFKVLYTGTFEPYQGLDLLIESAKKVVEHHKEIVFILVGGDQKQVDEYKKLVNKHHLDENFIFTGQVWPNLLKKFIDVADILVTPRIQGNNTPLKIYSYLRSGKPIVATNHPTHTQVLNDRVAILTEGTPESFGEGIIRLIENRDLMEDISRNARKLAEEKYSYEIYISRIKSIYEVLEKGIYSRK
jgi:glycosyltransferase involved in cell wall biosynthesis